MAYLALQKEMFTGEKKIYTRNLPPVIQNMSDQIKISTWINHWLEAFLHHA